MDVRLCDLLCCDFFSASRVLAGEKGLSNMVTSVTVLDSPDAPKYMKGGELVITTAYSLLNDPEAQQKVVENLAKCGAAGLGIKLRFFNQQLPRVMKETADQYNFPIINITDDYAYADIYEFVNSNLISRVTKEVKRADEVIKDITESISKNGLQGLVKSLYTWTGLGVLVLCGGRQYAYPAEAKNGYNYRDTAKIMYLHPNTVRYRIANIEKLCRVNLKYADDRLNMEIALKILPLINIEAYADPQNTPD